MRTLAYLADLVFLIVSIVVGRDWLLSGGGDMSALVVWSVFMLLVGITIGYSIKYGQLAKSQRQELETKLSNESFRLETLSKKLKEQIELNAQLETELENKVAKQSELDKARDEFQGLDSESIRVAACMYYHPGACPGTDLIWKTMERDGYITYVEAGNWPDGWPTLSKKMRTLISNYPNLFADIYEEKTGCSIEEYRDR